NSSLCQNGIKETSTNKHRIKGIKLKHVCSSQTLSEKLLSVVCSNFTYLGQELRIGDRDYSLTCVTQPPNTAQGTSWKRGWKRYKSQRKRKNAVKGYILDMM
ncbi:hypothetical protein STEG23_002093, partial [Scotinomys teguina]